MAVWGFAKLKRKSKKLFSEVGKQRERIAESGNVQAMVNVLWAYGGNAVHDSELFCAIMTNAKIIADEGTPGNISNAVWSCARIGFDAPILFASVDSNITKFLSSAEPSQIANLTWAFATNGIFSETLFKGISSEEEGGVMEILVEKCTEIEVCNLLWSYSIAGLLPLGEPLIKLLWSRACSFFPTLNGTHLQNLFIFFVTVQVEEKSGSYTLEIQGPSERFMIQMVQASNTRE